MISWYQSGGLRTELTTAWCVKYVECNPKRIGKEKVSHCLSEEATKLEIEKRLEQNAIDKTHWWKAMHNFVNGSTTGRRLLEEVETNNEVD